MHPIYKSDEKDDPNNFRGIAIASCFGKLFTKLWADDLVILSTSAQGLQNAINKTVLFYDDLGLDLNTNKDRNDKRSKKDK